jgi:hypothetical protein
MKKILGLATVLLLAASSAFAAATATGTTNLNLTVSNEANISITTTNTTLSSGTTTFNDYTGTTNYTYQIRTTQSGGTGSITVLISTDFSAGGGGLPSVAVPATTGDALTFTCTANVGTACSSAQTSSTTAAATAVTFGANAHAGAPGAVATNGAAGSVSWNFTNDPKYPTGSYQAVATFTISAA